MDADARSASGLRRRHTPPVYQQFEIGVRSYHFTLKDTRRLGEFGYDNANWEGNVNFLGSIWGLDAIQDYLPRLYVQFALTPFMGIGISYDQIGAETVDWANADKTRTASDGDLHLKGGLLYAFFRYPLWIGITPFGELGAAWYRSQLTERAVWRSYGEGFRLDVDNARGYFLGLGMNVALTENWALNVYFRQTFDLDVKARAYFSPESTPNRVGAFPMEYRMLGAGVAYLF